MLSKVTLAWPCLILLLFASRCAVPTMRQTLLCRSSSSKCVTRWPTWRGECYPPPCCSTAAGWAQSTLWYPSFKSRPFSLFVWHALPFCSLYSTFSVGELTHWLLCVLHDVTVFGLCGSVSVVQTFEFLETFNKFTMLRRSFGHFNFLIICNKDYFESKRSPNSWLDRSSSTLDTEQKTLLMLVFPLKSVEAAYWAWTSMLINIFLFILEESTNCNVIMKPLTQKYTLY